MGLFDRWTDPVAKAERLTAKAFGQLNAQDPEKALKTALDLRQLGRHEAYLIEADAHDMLGATDTAVSVLKAGLLQHPKVAALWLKLGKLHAESGQFEPAFAAFDEAAGCDDGDLPDLHYQRAIAFLMQGDFGACLAAAASVETESQIVRLETDALRVDAHCGLGQWDAAIAVAEAHLALKPDEDEAQHALGLILSGMAQALWRGRQDQDGAILRAVAAVDFSRSLQAPFRLIREFRNETATDAFLGELTLEGLWKEPFAGQKYRSGFYRQFEVVARNAEEAMAFARTFLPVEIHGSLRCEAWAPAAAAPAELLGVYGFTGYLFFGS
ncbi:MAG: hypothetical protein H7338_20285 [Candidatus Sericytochromatia bacterium]|nr:hypothetical protein [Candidatus Sericytochromatia bacterium]